MQRYYSLRALLLPMLLFPIYALAHLQYATHFSGITGPLLQNVKARFAINQAQQANLTQALMLRAFQHGPEDIRRALQPFGYFSPTINSQLQRLSPNRYQAHYQIKQGLPTLIQALHVNIRGPGRKNPVLQQGIKHFPLQKQHIFNSVQYHQAKQALLNLANQQGYLDAHFTTQTVDVDVARYSAIIHLMLATGKPYFVGALQINKTAYSSTFLRSFINLHTGQRFMPNQLLTLQDKINSSQYFRQVTITPLRHATQRQSVPIAVTFTPLPTKQYLLGIGYGTDTGIRGKVGVNFRRITPSGQRLLSEVSLSQKNNTASFKYTIPGTHPLQYHYNLTATLTNQRPQYFRSRAFRLGISKVSQFNRWQRILALIYQYDDNLGSDNIAPHTMMIYPSISWLYINAKKRTVVDHGARLGIDLLAGVGGKHWNNTTGRINVDAKMIVSPLSNSRFILRGDYGYTVTEKQYDLPLSLRFFTGGATSVRGYGFQDLGPGTQVIVGSAEWQQRLFGKCYATVFYDTGNASDSLHLITTLKQAVGTGFVFLTPVGPIAITIAHPLHDKQTKPWRLQFTVGPDL